MSSDAITVPPNDWGAACYWGLERGARAAGRGLWSEPRFAPAEAAALEPTANGFRIVRGAVTRIGRGGDSLWLELGQRITLRIPETDRARWFTERDPAALEGRRVEARGWVSRRQGALRMTVRHPRMLSIAAP